MPAGPRTRDVPRWFRGLAHPKWGWGGTSQSSAPARTLCGLGAAPLPTTLWESPRHRVTSAWHILVLLRTSGQAGAPAPHRPLRPGLRSLL